MLRQLLGFDRWVIVYEYKGSLFYGMAYMNKQDAKNFATHARHAVGIRKDHPLFRRVIWMR